MDVSMSTCGVPRRGMTLDVCTATTHTTDVEHTFIGCDRWWQERRNLEVKLGMDVTSERMVECMVQSKSKWDAIVKYITTIMKRKEADERTMQAVAVTG